MLNYVGEVDLSKVYWNLKKKVGVIMNLHSEIIGQEKPYRAIKTEQCMEMFPKLRINYPYKVRLDGNFG